MTWKAAAGALRGPGTSPEAARLSRALVIAAAAIAVAGPARGDGAPKDAAGKAAGPSYDAALDNEIEAMVAVDQRVRQTPSTELTNGDREAMRRVDALHEARMREIVATHGWPGRSLVGRDGAQGAWLIVQHCSREFEEACLPLLERAVAQGEASAVNYAYLLDRVRMYEGRPQVYGTQFMGNSLYPIEDQAHVDDRRRTVGLMPEAEYEAMVRKINKMPDRRPGLPTAAVTPAAGTPGAPPPGPVRP